MISGYIIEMENPGTKGENDGLLLLNSNQKQTVIQTVHRKSSRSNFP